MRADNVAKFMVEYRPALAECVKKYPGEYMTFQSRPGFDFQPDVVLVRMERAFVHGEYNHDGRAIKLAAKRLGIGSRRKDLEAFFEGVK